MGRSSKDKRDIFYRLAKEEGWRARSAFKLLQIQQTLNILDGVTRAVDLCAAPGSWSQVLAQTLMPKNEGDEKPYIVAVDLQTMSPIPGVKCIKGDITSEQTAMQIIDALGGAKAQIVVCDGAPDVTGLHELDERLQSQLLFAALSIATCILEENGTFVSKFFRASDEGIRFNFSRIKYFFQDVVLAKPRSSRASSMECFIVGRRFRLPDGFTPKVSFPDWPTMDLGSQSQAIPFISCGDLSGFDSETTYPLPENYVCREPVQKPIDPPYAAAVELRKTSKLSDKIRDSGPMDTQISQAIYSINNETTGNQPIVKKLEGLNLNISADDFIVKTNSSTSRPAGPTESSKGSGSTQSQESGSFSLGSSKPDVQSWTPVAPAGGGGDGGSGKSGGQDDAGGGKCDSSEESLRVKLSFRGGLEIIFGGVKDMDVALPLPPDASTYGLDLEKYLLDLELGAYGVTVDVLIGMFVKLFGVYNGTLKSMLAKCIDESQTNWDDMLGKVTFSYNNSVHSVTEFSPYYLLYGTMELLLGWMKKNIIRERPELFIKDGDIRPGILIFINDTDWELLEKLDYELAQGDRISFISTLHGG